MERDVERTLWWSPETDREARRKDGRVYFYGSDEPESVNSNEEDGVVGEEEEGEGEVGEVEDEGFWKEGEYWESTSDR
jgi:hypothetical protein